MTASNRRLQFNIPFSPRDFDWRPAIGNLAAKQDRSVAATARVLIRDALIRLGELPANAGTTRDPKVMREIKERAAKTPSTSSRKIAELL